MGAISVVDANAYVNGVEVASPLFRVFRAEGEVSSPALEKAFSTAAAQAAVVGSEVVSFVEGVTPARRVAILNSALLAQLVATKQVPDPGMVEDWYRVYFEVLSNVGWVVQNTSFARYEEKSAGFIAHEAIIKVAALLLGPGSSALALVTTTLDALRKKEANEPWMTLFNRAASTASTARFQVGLVTQDRNGEFIVDLCAFSLEASKEIVKVLIFNGNYSEVTFRHCSAKVTINSQVLDGVQEAVRKKLVGKTQDYVGALEI